jgi:hypothetical protein
VEPESQQREIMGGTMFDLWKSGRISFGDLSQERDDDVYGPMKSVATIKELLAKKPA